MPRSATLAPAASSPCLPATAPPSPRTYRPRTPQDTVLYDAVRTHLDAFLAFARERTGRELPKYVVDAFRKVLACGDLSRGVSLVRCGRCRHSFVVGFTCKGRGLCPSCTTRRTTGTAATLCDRVLPELPYRQWVLTFPRPWRMLLAKDAKVLSALHRIAVEEIERAYLRSTDNGAASRGAQRRTGSVTFVQRFSGSLGLHVHLHVLFADGVFVREADGAPDSGVLRAPRFVAAPAPTHDTLCAVLERLHRRSERWLRRHGHLAEIADEDRSNEAPDPAPLDACLSLASAQGTLALVENTPDNAAGTSSHDASDASAVATAARRTGKHSAALSGFDLHAGVYVAPQHREFLERLCRYGARPAFALDRLTKLPDGHFAYRMKYKLYGKTHRILEPMELMARFASIVPPPRFPLTRYAGVFSAGSRWRRLVVPSHPPERRCCATHERERKAEIAAAHEHDALIARGGTDNAASDATDTAHDTSPPPRLVSAVPTPSPHSTRVPWADLLRHGLDVDALKCTHCGSRMRIVSVVRAPDAVRRVLEHLGLAAADRDVPTRAWDPVPVDDASGAAAFDGVDAVYADA